MAIKGLGYTKTTWTFEERPVSSSKLASKGRPPGYAGEAVAV